MQNFIFENPTKIIFGQGQIKRIGAEIKPFGRKVLMVYGEGSIRKNGIYDQVTASLKEAGLSVVEFPGVKSNPLLSHTVKGIALARQEAVEVILAVGGGSVIDTAKTIAVGVKAEHDLWDYFTRKQAIKGALPILTVLTISASASEMNPAAVMTRDEGAQKFSIRSMHIQPKTSILDPTVLYTLSPAYSAYSAVDAISHMLEGYFNNTAPDSLLQDRLVEGLMKTIMESTEIILKNPTHYPARAMLMWSATLAFNGLTSAGMGMISLPVHMIEHSLSALYDVPHGAGLSILTPGWMHNAADKNPQRFARLAREIFAVREQDERAAALAGIGRLKAWFAGIGSPTSLTEVGIAEKDIEGITENAFTLAQVWQLKDYTREVISDILRRCL
jgi:alcohol dehydrogenase YqhD (iron-dependent ADH family)